MSGRPRNMIVLTIILSAAVLAGSMIEGGLPPVGCCLSAADSPQNSRKPKGGKVESVNEMMVNLEALIIDFAGHNTCDRLSGRYIPLSSGVPASGSGKITNTGIIRINTCNTEEVDNRHLKIELTGTGWQWISKKKQKLGATFTVSENVKFAVKISMVGTFDMAYDKAEHILNVWFVPTRPVDADLKVIGNVDVDTESLWSSIVGIAGSLGGKTSEQRAEISINKQGGSLFRAKLSKGLTLIMDLCTGQHYIKLGYFPAGRLPENTGKGKKYLVNSKGVLHEGGLLIAGPFDAEKPVIARFEAAQGGIEASIVCEDSAKKTEEAYVNGKALPKTETLAEGTAEPGRPVTLKVKAAPGCKVVLIMKPLEGQKGVSDFDYSAYHAGEKPKPFVDCTR